MQKIFVIRHLDKGYYMEARYVKDKNYWGEFKKARIFKSASGALQVDGIWQKNNPDADRISLEILDFGEKDFIPYKKLLDFPSKKSKNAQKPE